MRAYSVLQRRRDVICDELADSRGHRRQFERRRIAMRSRQSLLSDVLQNAQTRTALGESESVRVQPQPMRCAEALCARVHDRSLLPGSLDCAARALGHAWVVHRGLLFCMRVLRVLLKSRTTVLVHVCKGLSESL
jgi:hypothetical protein